MTLRETDPESYITECASVYEDECGVRHALSHGKCGVGHAVRHGKCGVKHVVSHGKCGVGQARAVDHGSSGGARCPLCTVLPKPQI